MEPARKRPRTDPSVPNAPIEDVNDFPSAVLRIIFAHVGRLKAVALVCRQWRDLAVSIMSERYMLTIQGSNVERTRELVTLLPQSRRVYQTVSVQLGEFAPDQAAVCTESLTNITSCLTILLRRGTVRSLRLSVAPDIDMVRFVLMNHVFLNTLEEFSVSMFNRSRAPGQPVNMEQISAEIPMGKLKSLKWEEFDDYSQVQFINPVFIFKVPLATKVELKRSEGLSSRTQSLVQIRQADGLQQLTIPNVDERFAKEFFTVSRPNLRHLELKEPLLVVPPPQLQGFARNLPQLESLSLGHVKGSFVVEIALARMLPNLTSLSLMTHKIMLSKLIEALAPITTLQKLHVDCEEDCLPGRSGNLVLPNLVDFSIEVHYYSPDGKQIQLYAPKLRKFHIFNACDDRQSIRVPSVRIAAIEQPHLSDLKFHWCPEYLALFRQQTFTELRKLSCTIWDPEPELATLIDARFCNLQHLALSLYNFRDDTMDRMMSNVFTHCRDLHYLELEFFAISFEALSGITRLENLTELCLKEGTIEGKCDRNLTVKRLQRIKLSCVIVEDDQLRSFAIRTEVIIHRYRNCMIGSTLNSTTICSEQRLDAFLGAKVAAAQGLRGWARKRRRNAPCPPTSEADLKLIQASSVKIVEHTLNRSVFPEAVLKAAMGPMYRATYQPNPTRRRDPAPVNSDEDSDGRFSDSDEEEAAMQEQQELEDLDAQLEVQLERFRANEIARRGIPD